MATLAPAELRVAAEVAHIASAPGRIDQRAAALLEPLNRLVPFQAAWISILDERQHHAALATQGHVAPMHKYFATPYAAVELELSGVNRKQPPMRLRDLPMPPGELRAWADHYWPAGFVEGLGVSLFTPDDRYLGHLCLLTDSHKEPTDAARELIGRLVPTIANAVDPMRSIVSAAKIVKDATAGVVVTRHGHTLPLPGLPEHPMLVPGSPVLTTATQQVSGRHQHLTFLFPCPTEHDNDNHARVTILAGPPSPPQYLTAVVVLSPPGDLHGLTGQELAILGQLIDGRSDPQIAAALHLTPRAVTEDIEHILDKLGAPTRLLGVVRASQQGLYVPPSLVVASP